MLIHNDTQNFTFLHSQDEFQVQKVLSSSQQAVIAKGVCPESSKPAILKRYCLATQRKAFLKETKVLSKLQEKVGAISSLP
jgi:predicted Ser/Thr protein kinase